MDLRNSFPVPLFKYFSRSLASFLVGNCSEYINAKYL